MKKIIYFLLLNLLVLSLVGCGTNSEDKVVIYTSFEDYRVDYMKSRLTEEFPDYEIQIEYLPTGNHAAKLISEGLSTDCDITINLEYSYLQQLDNNNLLADLSDYDFDVYLPELVLSNNYLPQERNGGSIILNTDLLKEKGIAEPKSYEDLLKPEYEGLISMPSPKSSGTGYMFLKSLVNTWGEEKAFAYFDQLTKNIIQYTSSGSGPINTVIQGEAAIGLGMTAQAITKINEGYNLKITTFEEGSPYSMYGLAMIKGKESKPKVKEVFDFLVNQFTQENCEKFYPEKIYKDIDFDIVNYPENIKYANMEKDNIEEKENLLAKWNH